MTKRNLSIRYAIVIVCLIISIFISLCVGSTMYSPMKALKGIFTLDDFILNEYRIPRTLLGFGVGSSLAISGAVIQGVVRNPLASPDVIGITKGASLAAIIVIMVFPTAPLIVLPIGSFIGALVISLILSFLISKFNIKGSTLALIGLAIGAICTAVVQFLLIRNPMDANNALIWLTGSLYGHTIENFYSIIPWFIITLPLVLGLSYQLDILNLGDNIAVALGAKVQHLKMILLILSVMLAGASISVVGGISFLGLISPHIARSLVGQRYFHVVIMSGLIGAVLILVSDGLARGIHPPLDIPVGVIIAIIGVPYFLFLLRRI
ncbi:iron chelate uptake ABC transporter family permease subunit [Staphylococcus sp. NRL 16/872]|uniref:FecCD family ABC transporter permease n=1 Tax=Staphylococcus sp. NRL 16/872 TaxID=2930131 RepID=UPI001FB31698|nr:MULTISPECIES: iron chelate uptake ABC transporter family permease subunit [unclassified Staphylococcus]MCJ1655854.1 iron chelate uptake ABC transporter family permease subunit [Staphylococcus sp. NRL 21/187]MCJ1661660.1 iron chelate uptake ABC transporter family permease subunit [Staphylococcus sp. NRL 18/288]MCJ1667589.1 iron chelate uptake ABC transporter family permease subunit [Staphylococcus sp. NRL 19/737]WEN70074.1 iron chelate uptake ABC transporter family permease subunit [Staphyloc